HFTCCHIEMSVDPENQMMIQERGSPTMHIDPGRARFPCCVVWTPLPVISWLIPFIGHMGICREDGVILDFAGPNFVCVDNFAFGAVARYIQINKDRCCISSHWTKREDRQGQEESERAVSTWDDALLKGTQEYQHRSYNLLTCNCHSFVANNLNRLNFNGGGWNVVNLAILMFLKGRWVNNTAIVKSYLPFIIALGLGLVFGGSTFLTFLAFFAFVLVGWFLFGTYCLKGIIQL
ncbi:TMEM222/RTE1, partial [Dillenia turbinata]